MSNPNQYEIEMTTEDADGYHYHVVHKEGPKQFRTILKYADKPSQAQLERDIVTWLHDNESLFKQSGVSF